MKALVYNIKLLCFPTCQFFFSARPHLAAPRSFPSKRAPLEHPCALLWVPRVPSRSRPEQSGTVSTTGGGARSAPPLVSELIQQRCQITTAAEMSTGPSSTPPPPVPAKTIRKKKKGIRRDCFGFRVRMDNLK